MLYAREGVRRDTVCYSDHKIFSMFLVGERSKVAIKNDGKHGNKQQLVKAILVS
jgi:hypothetical protein